MLRLERDAWPMVKMTKATAVLLVDFVKFCRLTLFVHWHSRFIVFIGVVVVLMPFLTLWKRWVEMGDFRSDAKSSLITLVEICVFLPSELEKNGATDGKEKTQISGLVGEPIVRCPRLARSRSALVC